MKIFSTSEKIRLYIYIYLYSTFLLFLKIQIECHLSSWKLAFLFFVYLLWEYSHKQFGIHGNTVYLFFSFMLKLHRHSLVI